MTGHLLRLLVAAVLAAAIAGCGGDDDAKSGAAAEPTATAAPADLTDTKAKPQIPKPSGEPPTRLVKRDIVKGTGPAVKAGDQVTVQYAGVLHSTGEEFDASWDRGEPFTFTAGAQEVIAGWDEGVPGMRVGGRRELVIPPDKAYGEAGQGDIGPNETLVFVIDLVERQAG